MIITDMEERIRTMDLKQAYNFMVTDENVPTGLKEKARFGFMKPGIDIYDYFNSNFMVKKKRGEVLHNGRRFKITDIYTDMEKRLVLIKKYLIKEFGGSDPLARSR